MSKFGLLFQLFTSVPLSPLFGTSYPSASKTSVFSTRLFARLDRMTAGKAACLCTQPACFCRFKNSSGSNRPPIRPTPLPPPLARSQLDPRDLALVAEISRMGWCSSNRAGGGNRRVGGGEGVGATGGAQASDEGASSSGGAGGVHPDCALEFAERFVRRDIALAGRAQAVRLLNGRFVLFRRLSRCTFSCVSVLPWYFLSTQFPPIEILVTFDTSSLRWFAQRPR